MTATAIHGVSRATSDRRLLKLAEKLESLPRKRFDYGTWVGGDWKGAPDLSCGTTACALGWATTIPSLRRVGLRMGRRLHEPVLVDTDDSVIASSPTEVAGRVFGLTEEEAYSLFFPRTQYGGRRAPDWSATPKTVARHIRRFVADRDELARRHQKDYSA